MRSRAAGRSLILFVAGAGLLFGGPTPSAGAHGGAPAGRCCNPMAPLEIEITRLPRRKEDAKGQRRVQVRVTPRVSAPGLEVRLTLPPGVTLLRGESGWRSPAVARVAQTRELLLEAPATGEQRLVATARLVFRRSLPMAAVASCPLNDTAPTPEPRGARAAPLEEPETLPTIATAGSAHD